MRTSLCLGAAAATLALGGVHASACDNDCGYGHRDYGVYHAPPPVSYHAPTAYGHYAPVAVFGGPRWAYGYPRYYTAPVVYAGPGRRSWPYRHVGPRFYGSPYRYARPYHAYARGPVVRTWGRW